MALQASCVVDEVTQLSVCTIDEPAVTRLHALIERISNYLEVHHLARTEPYGVPYHYRTNYLPDRISGNDIAAVSRIIAEAKVRGILIPSILLPLAAQGLVPVTSADVEYLATYADEVIDPLETLYATIQAIDGTPSKLPWLILGGLVATVFIMTYAGGVSSKREYEKR
jgi:hypothetical protein